MMVSWGTVGSRIQVDYFECNNSFTFQLGGGYVLARDLVEYLGMNSKLFKIYKNEDVAVGAWLAGLDVK